MISICIPIYQYEVYDLVKEIQKQCNDENIEFEIICIDDHSELLFKQKNKRIKNFKNTFYIELNKNHGRAKIRNLFIGKVNYSSLLFLDCDCSIPNENFISKYYQNIDKELVYGGRKHFKNKPQDNSLSLRWKYGKKREDLTLRKRIKSPFLSFRSNNFMVRKEVLIKVNFDESIKTYGHEDTLLALQLKKEGVLIHHIDNYVIHEGLENNIEFISKTKTAIITLNNLFEAKKLNLNDIKIFKVYGILKFIKLTRLISFSHSYISKICLVKLQKENPNIFWLDIYKLFYLFKIRGDV